MGTNKLSSFLERLQINSATSHTSKIVTMKAVATLITLLITATTAISRQQSLLPTRPALLLSPRTKSANVVGIRGGGYAFYEPVPWQIWAFTSVVGLQGLASYVTPVMYNRKHGVKSSPFNAYFWRRKGMIKIASAVLIGNLGLGTSPVKASGISILVITMEVVRSLTQGDARKAGLTWYHDFPLLLVLPSVACHCLLQPTDEADWFESIHELVGMIAWLMELLGLFAVVFPKQYLQCYLRDDSNESHNDYSIMSIRSLGTSMVLYAMTLALGAFVVSETVLKVVLIACMLSEAYMSILTRKIPRDFLVETNMARAFSDILSRKE